MARTEGTTFKTGGVEMSLRDYFAYARGVAFDETPMYLFDKMFGEKVRACHCRRVRLLLLMIPRSPPGTTAKRP